MFFAKWILEYHFPALHLAAVIFIAGLMVSVLGRPREGIITIIAALIVWCGMDMLEYFARHKEFIVVPTEAIRRTQAYGGIWAVAIFLAVIGGYIATIVSGHRDLLTISIAVLGGIVLVAMMIWQVLHKAGTGPDLTASCVSYAQQLAPTLMWVYLLIINWGSQ